MRMSCFSDAKRAATLQVSLDRETVQLFRKPWRPGETRGRRLRMRSLSMPWANGPCSSPCRIRHLRVLAGRMHRTVGFVNVSAIPHVARTRPSVVGHAAMPRETVGMMRSEFLATCGARAHEGRLEKDEAGRTPGPPSAGGGHDRAPRTSRLVCRLRRPVRRWRGGGRRCRLLPPPCPARAVQCGG